MEPVNQLQNLKQRREEPFSRDVLDWFSKKRDGHMGKWQYFDPAYEDDPARGALLWEEWAQTDFYMLKNQKQLIQKHAQDIANITGPIDLVLDLGPGELSAVESNTLPFMKAYAECLHYVPVDICDSYADGAARFIHSHTGKNCQPLNADFTRKLEVPKTSNLIALCFGSIIGNYEGVQGVRYSVAHLVEELKLIKQNIPQGSYLLIGLDGNQDSQSLYNSYDHSIHGAYEINVLYKIKRDLLSAQSGFQPDKWRYAMCWYPKSYQFCHIAECKEDQTFQYMGQHFTFEKGEQLVVDNSFKFPVGIFQQAAIKAGYKPEASFLDDQKAMALHLLKVEFSTIDPGRDL